jgi:hypothetical protein
MHLDPPHGVPPVFIGMPFERAVEAAEGSEDGQCRQRIGPFSPHDRSR